MDSVNKCSADLHVHSSFSPDAADAPEALGKSAKAHSLSGIVITDHNACAHFPAVRAMAEQYGFPELYGVEITASDQGSDIHILGYARTFDAALLTKELEETVAGYNDRSRQMIQRINELGIADLSFDSLLEAAEGGCVTKPKIAKAIMDQKNIPYASALKYLERGGEAYLPYGSWALSPEAAIDLVIRAGGKAVLAHPGDFFTKRSSLSIEERGMAFDLLLPRLKKAGLWGLEVYYPSHTAETIASFLDYAEKYALQITGGSDYHGSPYTGTREVGDAGLAAADFERFLKALE